jgi:membrane protein YdbS with pleckstrin-like domain
MRYDDRYDRDEDGYRSRDRYQGRHRQRPRGEPREERHLGALLDDILRFYGFQTPDEIVEGHLAVGGQRPERHFLTERPNPIGLFINLKFTIAFAVGALLLARGSGTPRLVGALVLLVLAVIWLAKYVALHYTRYVITSLRVLRVSGVFGRKADWIPWMRVTEVSFHQNMLHRLVRLGSIRIDSANDIDTLKELTDIRNPGDFHRRLAQVVSGFQNHSTYELDALAGE